MKSLLATAVIASSSLAEQLFESHRRELRAPPKSTNNLMDPTADSDWTESVPQFKPQIINLDPVMQEPIISIEPKQIA